MKKIIYHFKLYELYTIQIFRAFKRSFSLLQRLLIFYAIQSVFLTLSRSNCFDFLRWSIANVHNINSLEFKCRLFLKAAILDENTTAYSEVCARVELFKSYPTHSWQQTRYFNHCVGLKVVARYKAVYNLIQCSRIAGCNMIPPPNSSRCCFIITKVSLIL